MDAEQVFLLVLVGYALGLTMALFVMMSRSQTQPTTVVVQQTPENGSASGCGTLMVYAVLALIFFVVVSQILA